MELFWDNFGMILRSYWGNFRIMLGSFWGHVAITLGSPGHQIRTNKGSFCDHVWVENKSCLRDYQTKSIPVEPRNIFWNRPPGGPGGYFCFYSALTEMATVKYCFKGFKKENGGK